jgi:hypothetical protein
MKKLQQYSACLASAQPAAATSSALSAAHFTVRPHTTRCMSQDLKPASRPARLHRPWPGCD